VLIFFRCDGLVGSLQSCFSLSLTDSCMSYVDGVLLVSYRAAMLSYFSPMGESERESQVNSDRYEHIYSMSAFVLNAYFDLVHVMIWFMLRT